MLNNPMLKMLGATTGQPTQNNIMMQALGAMMRGESPQSFMQNLAKTNPALQGLDLNNLNQTAEKLYSEKGQDINTAKNKISQFVGSFK